MSNIKLLLISTATCLFLFPAIVFSQTKPAEPQKPESGETQDVIKFDTSLVQTDVTVFDKNGRFVDGLKPEQFQLKIDKTQREISFFERFASSGSGKEREEPSGQPTGVEILKSGKQQRAV